jgi:hypothetical protein
MEFTKEEKHLLRELKGYLYELELIEATRELSKDVKAWENNVINVWELNERIHNYHDGISKNLYLKYTITNIEDIEMLIRFEVTEGKIKIENLPSKFSAIIEKIKLPLVGR